MGNKVLKSKNGFYLSAEEGHLHGKTERTEHTNFQVEEHDHGAKVSLKTHNNHYVAVNSNLEIILAHHHSGDEAKFHLEHHDGRVAFKSHHGGFLTINDEGHVHVQEEKVPGALFEEISV